METFKDVLLIVILPMFVIGCVVAPLVSKMV